MTGKPRMQKIYSKPKGFMKKHAMKPPPAVRRISKGEGRKWRE